MVLDIELRALSMLSSYIASPYFNFKETCLALGHWWLMPVTLAAWEVKSGGLQFETSLGKHFMRSPSLKIEHKWTGDVAQVVECMFCKP
jgi:hypothetical protein